MILRIATIACGDAYSRVVKPRLADQGSGCASRVAAQPPTARERHAAARSSGFDWRCIGRCRTVRAAGGEYDHGYQQSDGFHLNIVPPVGICASSGIAMTIDERMALARA
jgi:hypothetical protein